MCHERWALHVVIKPKFFFTFVADKNGAVKRGGLKTRPVLIKFFFAVFLCVIYVVIVSGVYTREEWCEMHHGENWVGGNVVSK